GEVEVGEDGANRGVGEDQANEVGDHEQVGDDGEDREDGEDGEDEEDYEEVGGDRGVGEDIKEHGGVGEDGVDEEVGEDRAKDGEDGEDLANEDQDYGEDTGEVGSNKEQEVGPNEEEEVRSSFAWSERCLKQKRLDDSDGGANPKSGRSKRVRKAKWQKIPSGEIGVHFLRATLETGVVGDTEILTYQFHLYY
ncbi:hypothetical protein HK102_010322, partial [Quaeritorhiza haematococci]